ncbi:MAG TPA: integrase core domain-containing protein [Burkholderiales bacterium]|nr:integrase core domain-containing protein [Burkholderiales bacterium]
MFHTDRGIEYAAGAFKQRTAELGITLSMNRPGKITDNAFIESFFHSMKADVFHGNRFDDDGTVRSLLKQYLPFYNRARLHSSLIAARFRLRGGAARLLQRGTTRTLGLVNIAWHLYQRSGS